MKIIKHYRIHPKNNSVCDLELNLKTNLSERNIGKEKLDIKRARFLTTIDKNYNKSETFKLGDKQLKKKKKKKCC